MCILVLGVAKAVDRISKFLHMCIVKMRLVNRANYDIVSGAQSMLGVCVCVCVCVCVRVCVLVQCVEFVLCGVV